MRSIATYGSENWTLSSYDGNLTILLRELKWMNEGIGNTDNDIICESTKVELTWTLRRNVRWSHSKNVKEKPAEASVPQFHEK